MNCGSGIAVAGGFWSLRDLGQPAQERGLRSRAMGECRWSLSGRCRLRFAPLTLRGFAVDRTEARLTYGGQLRASERSEDHGHCRWEPLGAPLGATAWGRASGQASPQMTASFHLRTQNLHGALLVTSTVAGHPHLGQEFYPSVVTLRSSPCPHLWSPELALVHFCGSLKAGTEAQWKLTRGP